MKVILPISLDRWASPIATLLRACVEHNPDVEFHSFSDPESDEDRSKGEVFWRLPNLRKRRPAVLAWERFDLVQTASFSRGNHRAAMLAKIRGAGRTRYLTTLNIDPWPEHREFWTGYQGQLKWCDGVAAVSEAVAADARKRIPDRFLGVIPNGVDPAWYDPEAARNAEMDLPAKVRDLPAGFALWLAVVEPRKHPEVFIELARNNPDVSFVALGKFPTWGNPEHRQAFEGTPNIFWLGQVSRDVGRAVLARSGALIFPSEREGLSLAMIEALAMGVPIIAQPVSSMPELIRPGFNGELIPSNDLEAWNDALRSMISASPAERRARESRIREDAISRYSWGRIGGAYGAVYRELLTHPRRLTYSLRGTF